MTNTPKRIRQLDVLRGIAVLLVIFRHIHVSVDNAALTALQYRALRTGPSWEQLPVFLLGTLCRCGWMGVDLFFALSGFLVSGLLFREYRDSGRIRVGRFLIRRGFKIYPPFYIFLIASVVGALLFSSHALHWPVVLSEALFVQNYGPHLWAHTWSLAVEEHFYLVLGLLLLGLLRWERFNLLPRICAGMFAFVLVLRVISSWRWPDYDFTTHIAPTHLRLDALFYGVALSYLWHFHRDRLLFAERKSVRPWLLLGSLACLCPPLVIPQSAIFMRTLGLTLLSIGTCGLLLWSLTGTPVRFAPVQWITRGLAAVGFHSYSIYLWHLPVLVFLVPRVAKITAPLGGETGWGELSIFVILCLLVGIGAAKLIEVPALRLRDRWFRTDAAGATPLTLERQSG